MRLIDQGPDEIRRQEVRGELQTVKSGVDAAGEAGDGQGFRQAGDALDEDVAVGEDADEQVPEHLLLADDDLVDFVVQAAERPAGGLDDGTDVLDVELRHAL